MQIVSHPIGEKQLINFPLTLLVLFGYDLACKQEMNWNGCDIGEKPKAISFVVQVQKNGVFILPYEGKKLPSDKHIIQSIQSLVGVESSAYNVDFEVQF